jgi:transcriptional regulator with XRE-family HTH domain
MTVRVRQAALEAALARRNLTKTALAREMGYTRTHVLDVLAGRVSPGPKMQRRILDVLGGSFAEFFEVINGGRRRRSRLRDLRDLS